MKSILSFLILSIFLFCGCTPRYVDSGGIRCEALSEKEEQELILEARFLVRAIQKKLKPGEFRYVADVEPQLKIRYTGDRCGYAKVWWALPSKEIVVDFDGIFLTSRMHSQIYTREYPPELVDFSKKNPHQADQTIKKTPRKADKTVKKRNPRKAELMIKKKKNYD